MPAAPKYKRVVLKISGESLCTPGGWGIEASAVEALAGELLPLPGMGVQVALVVGAGNILRGKQLVGSAGVRRATADYMGMMATVMNALALRDCLASRGAGAVAMSAIAMPSVCETWNRWDAISHLRAGQIVILAGGTGNPFFTTDTCAALRACELEAEVVLKATKVDGVFDSDPVTHPSAKRYDKLTYQKVLADNLGVMDLAAVSLCMEADIPIVVFKLAEPGNLAGAVCGQSIGTIVTR